MQMQSVFKRHQHYPRPIICVIEYFSSREVDYSIWDANIARQLIYIRLAVREMWGILFNAKIQTNQRFPRLVISHHSKDVATDDQSKHSSYLHTR